MLWRGKVAKKILILGTGSSVGKSIVVAGLCRLFNDMGYRVAPFKSQNMALNSFVTEEGLEMGRAQVVQAEASRVKPHVSMNPILLKPTSDVGSQVILHGKVYKNLKAKDYFDIKETLIPEIMKAYKALDCQYDLIIMEGAGSPAEINLRSRDIVNMGMAELVDADALLVGDVDKGGVFASLYGTYMLLEEEERRRIKGFIINKFRGDQSLLMSGVLEIEKRIGIPCMGILPYIHKLDIDDEDSVTDRFTDKRVSEIVIGVIKLPYLSNFTDFTSFECEKEVALKYIEHPSEIASCDLIIIPGSKNTLNDMRFLNLSGMQSDIYKAWKKSTPIIGICGGYQMLGTEILDPHAVESQLGRVNGLGLLNVRTIMSEEKNTRQTHGTFLQNPFGLDMQGQGVKGYEIHMGVTEALDSTAIPLMKTDTGDNDGHIDLQGHVFGTYFHGIFDNDMFRKRLINYLRQAKGLDVNEDIVHYSEYKEDAYNRLAYVMLPHLKMDKIIDVINNSREIPC